MESYNSTNYLRDHIPAVTTDVSYFLIPVVVYGDFYRENIIRLTTKLTSVIHRQSLVHLISAANRINIANAASAMSGELSSRLSIVIHRLTYQVPDESA